VRLNAQGYIINDADKPVPVLHQYDRILHVEKVLLGSLRQNL
jgi:hypothetical protein